jgi:hypothetical protein
MRSAVNLPSEDPKPPNPGASRVDEVYAKLTFAAGLLFAGAAVAYFCSAQSSSFTAPPIDFSGYAIGRDFLNTWMGGRSAFIGGPGPWFNSAAYNTVLQHVTGRSDLPSYYWSYPPQLILLTWPLGLLPYVPAYVLWCVGGLALYLWAVRYGGVERKYRLFLTVAPAVAVNVLGGQNGFFTAALLIGGLANLDRRPSLAGILFGILTIKPQFGLLLPAMLVVTGRWRVIAAAFATTLILVGMTAIWFGPAIWLEYFREVMPQQRQLIHDAGAAGWPVVVSALVNARLIGLPSDAAWLIQAVVSGCAAGLVLWTFWRRRDAVLSLALFVTATFLFSPWMLNYDLVVFGWVIALLRQRSDNTAADDILAIALWALPAIMLPLGAAHVPIAMLVLPAFAGRLIWRLAHAEERAARAGIVTA